MRARRGWAWPLVPLYAAGLAVKNGLRAVGILRVRRLLWPVVSVGSLSAGGAGKTPVVIALAELLRQRGWGVDVLSRGYGRAEVGVEQVYADGVDAAGRFGDEPVVIARRAGVAVWVGAERFAAGMMAERVTRTGAGGSWGAQEVSFDAERAQEHVPRAKAHADFEVGVPGLKSRPISGTDFSAAAEARASVQRVHLLDDGFQHRGLARTMDVVVVTEADLEDVLLPAGNRREGLRALRRADAVVLREEERGRIEQQVRGWMREGAAVWSVRRELRLEADAGARLVAFCGIARPEGFWAGLAQTGCEVVDRVAFGDHHAYGMEDVERLARIAGECGATGFATTEKDAVKLTAAMMERLGRVGPVCVARLDAAFVDEAEVVRELEGRIG